MFSTLARYKMTLKRFAFYRALNTTVLYRAFLLALPILFCYLLTSPALASETHITAVRMGLAESYTRVTLESDRPIHYELSMLDNPGRVVVDLENVTMNHVIKGLPNKLDPANPLIEHIRFGRFKPHIIRLVFDLKMHVVPRAFVLEPIEQYGHRLVLDIYYPDKAAISENKSNAQKYATGMIMESGEADRLEEFVASLPKRKPVHSEHDNTSLPKSYYAAQHRKPMPSRIIVVAIDPGHGGKDPGALGKHGTREKDVTLAISRKLKQIIDRQTYMRAILTRDADYDLHLKQRQAIARKHNADLFVSIHADGSPRRHAHGSSVYTLSENGATSTTASWLARKENSVDHDLVGGVDITEKTSDMREIILDLSMNATINDSVKVAELVLSSLGQINQLHKKSVEQAGFVVLKSPDIPSILVETAFITNPGEEKKLKNNTYQKEVAHAIFSGIKKYFDTNPALARANVAQAR